MCSSPHQCTTVKVISTLWKDDVPEDSRDEGCEEEIAGVAIIKY